jgi:hypothetical protein
LCVIYVNVILSHVNQTGITGDRPKWCSGYDDRLPTERFRVRIPGKVWFFPLKFEFFWLSSGLGGQLSLTLINWREWRIQIMSGVIVIVVVIGYDYQLILKNSYKLLPVTSDFLNQIHATQKSFRPWTQDEYKISDCDSKDKTVVHIRPVLWPACRSATPPLTIHPSISLTPLPSPLLSFLSQRARTKTVCKIKKL